MSFSPALPNSMGVTAPEHQAASGAIPGELAAPAAGVSDAEVYQVIFAPDDIRELTLEQLDDCFRLGLVDEETWVWTEGMENWEMLGEAAGLGAGEAEPDSTVRPRPGAQLGTPPPLPGELPPPLPGAPFHGNPGAYHQIASAPAAIRHGTPAWGAVPQDSTWPSAPAVDRAAVEGFGWAASASDVPESMPAAYAAPPAAAYSAPPAAAYSAPPAAAYSAPPAAAYSAPPAAAYSAPPAAAYSAPPAYHQAGASYPPSTAASGPFPGVVDAVSAPSAPVFAPQTAPPLVFDTQEENPFRARSGRRRGRFQAALLLACLLVGGTVSAYRNDLLLVAAQRADLEAAYLHFEQQWFGGAPAGTPRHVRGLVGGAEATKSVTLGASTVGSLQAAPAKPPAPSTATDEAVERGSEDAPSAKEAPQQTERPSGALAANEEERAPSAPRDEDDEALEPASSAASERSSNALVQAKRSPPKPAVRSRAVASKPRTVSKPAAAPAKPAKPAPATKPASASAKPAPAPGTDDFLRMSMRQAVKSGGSSGSKPKKKPSAAAYDPLNGDI